MTRRKGKALEVEGMSAGPPPKKVRVEGADALIQQVFPSYPEGFLRDAPKGADLNALTQLDFPGKVHLVTGANEGDVDWTALNSAKVLGFDTETRPVFRKGVLPNPTALIQLATEDEVWIFQLLPVSSLLPVGVSEVTKKRLQAVLQSPAVKVGVGLNQDICDLCRFHFPSMKSASGVVDLQDIVRPYRLRSTTLRALAAMFLCRRIAKAQQLSNWGNAKLTQGQIRYAAVDAWAGWKLHVVLRSLFEESEQWAPPRSLTITDG
ncbi:unnamed protein product [Polarella glacialis]|nr:unnamed protein product [Polarella glacialis]